MQSPKYRQEDRYAHMTTHVDSVGAAKNRDFNPFTKTGRVACCGLTITASWRPVALGCIYSKAEIFRIAYHRR
jgi:hypothetical protein